MILKEYEGERKIKIHMEKGLCGLWLRPDGYGVFFSPDGDGWPILLEIWEGRLRLLVWNDINKQDPMIIDMENARESNRKEGE